MSDALIAAVVGLLSGAFGAYVGVRVSLAKMEEWIRIRESDIKGLMRDRALQRDDIMTHDYEIALLMEKGGLKRAQRQRLRE